MTSHPVGTYLRFLRKQSGLSQKDLAQIVGSVSPSQVSRHEHSRSLPTLLAAFGYQVVFKRPVSEIFPGLYHAVEFGVQENIEELKRNLGKENTDEDCAGPSGCMVRRFRKFRNSHFGEVV